MDDVDLIEKAIEGMLLDRDKRWGAVAQLMSGAPLRYAQILAGHPARDRLAASYPDAGRAVAVARLYLGQEG